MWKYKGSNPLEEKIAKLFINPRMFRLKLDDVFNDLKLEKHKIFDNFKCLKLYLAIMNKDWELRSVWYERAVI